MFEARLVQGQLLKKIMDSIKDLVSEGNFDVSRTGIALQAMDASHVSLCALLLRSDGFDQFRADRNKTLGINIGSMSKMLKCAGNEDVVTMRADDHGDTVTFIFESEKDKRVSEFDLKLVDIDTEQLGIPETEYSAVVTMPSSEFQRICTVLAVVGDAVQVIVTKEGIKFSTKGDSCNVNISIGKNESPEKDEDAVTVDLTEPVCLSFALRYLNFFTKASPLSSQVSISLAKGVPLMVEYKIEDMGYVRYYLAPKIEDEDE
eukprot:Rmarinus@m.29306